VGRPRTSARLFYDDVAVRTSSAAPRSIVSFFVDAYASAGVGV
jgi:hypothetical protein